MRIPASVKCDVDGCGKIKGPENGWWVVWLGSHAVCVGPSAQNDPRKIEARLFDCCGQEHAIQKASELMGRIKHG